jgi:hypothetical protein
VQLLPLNTWYELSSYTLETYLILNDFYVFNLNNNYDKYFIDNFNQFNDINLHNSLSNVIEFSNIDSINTFTEHSKSLLHYSIPNTRLFYPEAFIATPSFLHSDM